MSKVPRKLNALEQKIHQAVLAGDDSTLSQEEIDRLEADGHKRVEAINFLLATGLLAIRANAKGGGISYRAIGRKEIQVKKDLSPEEVLVLNHVQATGNEGIWTKHIKAKTDLHQTVVDRCIKSLMQKQLIKPVKNVKFPTRKIYMLAHLEPSTAITGGPWYTDNELDTEFIKLLMSACLKFIKERSFPKSSSESNVLFPISAAPSYPTVKQIQTFLLNSRITETKLSVEHIDQLLNVLMIDGEIERIPAFGAAMWAANGKENTDDSEEEGNGRKRKKRDKKEKKKRRKTVDSEEGSSSDEEDTRSKKKAKRTKAESEEEEIEDEEKGGGLGEPTMDAEEYGGAYVYRAIRQERVVLGWSQAPCGHCPQFDFCKTGGPVNPQQCAYYGEWLTRTEVAIED